MPIPLHHSDHKPFRSAVHRSHDLVHQLAELLENATMFSSPRTRVTVCGRGYRVSAA